MEEAGLYQAPVPTMEEGNYRATVTASDESGELIGTGETGWTIDRAAEEFRRTTPNRALMGEIAAKSGGEIVAADRLKEFVKGLPEREAPVMEVRSDPLWHTPWIFLAALLCFAGEWALRRRHGLV